MFIGPVHPISSEMEKRNLNTAQALSGVGKNNDILRVVTVSRKLLFDTYWGNIT